MKVFFLLIALMLTNNAYSQSIAGRVLDGKTRKPVPDAYVYLNGTSFYATTDAEGRFLLSVDKMINTSLIVNHITYEIQSVPNPFTEMPDEIYLSEKHNNLNTLIVDQFTRETKLKAFCEQFLGQSKAGKSCKILNEDDIILYFNNETRTLSAESLNPLIIVNEYLQYRVVFSILNCKIKYRDKKLISTHVQETHLAGTSMFTDLKPADAKLEKRRNEVYINSSNNFFKHFINRSLKKAGYQVFNKSLPTNPDSYFIFADTLAQTLVHLKPDTDINKSKLWLKPSEAIFYGRLSVLFRKKLQTEVYFFTDSFFVDRYGNIDAIDRVIFSGQMGENRVGDMLPIEYEID